MQNARIKNVSEMPLVSSWQALALVAIAILGVLALGFYERRRMFDVLDGALQRSSMATQQALSFRAYGMPPPLQGEREAGARPLPEIPSNGDLSDDDTWKGMQGIWEREALEQAQAEQHRVDVITAALKDAQARRAAELEAQDKLAPSEPAGHRDLEPMKP